MTNIDRIEEWIYGQENPSTSNVCMLNWLLHVYYDGFDDMVVKKAIEEKGRASGLVNHLKSDYQPKILTWTGVTPLFRGTNSLSLEIKSYLEKTNPVERLTWTSWNLGEASSYIRTANDPNCGVIIYACQPIHNLLRVYFNVGSSTISKKKYSQMDRLMSDFERMNKKTRNKTSETRRQMSQLVRPLVKTELDVRPSLLGFRVDDKFATKINQSLGGTTGSDYEIEQNEITRIVHSKYNGWYNENDYSQIMLWDVQRWLTPALIYREQKGIKFVFAIHGQNNWIPMVLDINIGAQKEIKRVKQLPPWLHATLLLAAEPERIWLSDQVLEMLDIPSFIKETSLAPFLNQQHTQDQTILVEYNETSKELTFNGVSDYQSYSLPDVKRLLEVSYQSFEHIQDLLFARRKSAFMTAMRTALASHTFFRTFCKAKYKYTRPFVPAGIDWTFVFQRGEIEENITLLMDRTSLLPNLPITAMEAIQRGGDFRFQILSVKNRVASAQLQQQANLFEFMLINNIILPPSWLSSPSDVIFYDRIDKQVIEFLSSPIFTFKLITMMVVTGTDVIPSKSDYIIRLIQCNLLTQSNFDSIIRDMFQLAVERSKPVGENVGTLLEIIDLATIIVLQSTNSSFINCLPILRALWSEYKYIIQDVRAIDQFDTFLRLHDDQKNQSIKRIHRKRNTKTPSFTSTCCQWIQHELQSLFLDENTKKTKKTNNPLTYCQFPLVCSDCESSSPSLTFHPNLFSSETTLTSLPFAVSDQPIDFTLFSKQYPLIGQGYYGSVYRLADKDYVVKIQLIVDQHHQPIPPDQPIIQLETQEIDLPVFIIAPAFMESISMHVLNRYYEENDEMKKLIPTVYFTALVQAGDIMYSVIVMDYITTGRILADHAFFKYTSDKYNSTSTAATALFSQRIQQLWNMIKEMEASPLQFWHYDMNLNNIMLDAEGEFVLLDYALSRICIPLSYLCTYPNDFDRQVMLRMVCVNNTIPIYSPRSAHSFSTCKYTAFWTEMVRNHSFLEQMLTEEEVDELQTPYGSYESRKNKSTKLSTWSYRRKDDDRCTILDTMLKEGKEFTGSCDVAKQKRLQSRHYLIHNNPENDPIEFLDGLRQSFIDLGHTIDQIAQRTIIIHTHDTHNTHVQDIKEEKRKRGRKRGQEQVEDNTWKDIHRLVMKLSSHYDTFYQSIAHVVTGTAMEDILYAIHGLQTECENENLDGVTLALETLQDKFRNVQQDQSWLIQARPLITHTQYAHEENTREENSCILL